MLENGIRGPKTTLLCSSICSTDDHSALLVRQLLRRDCKAGRFGYRRSVSLLEMLDDSSVLCRQLINSISTIRMALEYRVRLDGFSCFVCVYGLS